MTSLQEQHLRPVASVFLQAEFLLSVSELDFKLTELKNKAILPYHAIQKWVLLLKVALWTVTKLLAWAKSYNEIIDKPGTGELLWKPFRFCHTCRHSWELIIACHAMFFFISKVKFQDESMICFWKHLEGELVLSFALSTICDETLQMVHIFNQASVNNAKYRQNTNWLWASSSFEDFWMYHRSQEWSTRLLTFKLIFIYFCFNSHSYLGDFLAIPLCTHCACSFSVTARLSLGLNLLLNTNTAHFFPHQSA